MEQNSVLNKITMSDSKDQYIDLNLAERMINKYDGNKSNLHVFIDNCSNAFQLLKPSCRIPFVSIVLSKIEGNIRSTLLNRSFSSWEDLKSHLLENYSEKRTFAQWQLELNSCRQNFKETVTSYSGRIENCYIKLIKSLDLKLTKEAREANVNLLKNQALNIFINGLQPQLHILLKSQKPNNFEEAVSIALSEEQEIKSRMEMFSNNRQGLQCFNCNKLGHSASNCRNSNIRHMQSNNNNANRNCFRCGKPGHFAKYCNLNNDNKPRFNNNFKRNYSNNGNNFRGNKPNHNGSNERYRNNNQENNVSLNEQNPRVAATVPRI